MLQWKYTVANCVVWLLPLVIFMQTNVLSLGACLPVHLIRQHVFIDACQLWLHLHDSVASITSGPFLFEDPLSNLTPILCYCFPRPHTVIWWLPRIWGLKLDFWSPTDWTLVLKVKSFFLADVIFGSAWGGCTDFNMSFLAATFWIRFCFIYFYRHAVISIFPYSLLILFIVTLIKFELYL